MVLQTNTGLPVSSNLTVTPRRTMFRRANAQADARSPVVLMPSQT
ncbi:conserved hypothetical protein [Burkholderia pseudomallei 576]|nr:conserved hypothetical protein [Burkholderia pseudomallei 576]